MERGLREVSKETEFLLDELSEAEQRRVLSIFQNVLKILRTGSEREDARSKKLVQVANYASRKAKEIDPKQIDADTSSLRYLRNTIVHGRLEILPPAEERKNYATLWRILTRSAEQWEPSELSNFLSYCLGIRPFEMDPYQAGGGKIIALYKAHFNTFSDEQKRKVLKEIVLRLFSDPKLRRLLAVSDIDKNSRPGR